MGRYRQKPRSRGIPADGRAPRPMANGAHPGTPWGDCHSSWNGLAVAEPTLSPLV